MKRAAYNLGQVGRLKAAMLADENVVAMIGPPATHDEIVALASVLQRLLPSRISREVLERSLTYLTRQDITESALSELAWRIAGNVQRLSKGHSAAPWAAQREPEWMPMQFVEAEETASATGKPGYTFKLRVLAGSACPMFVSQFYVRRFCYVLAQALGFSKSYGKYPFTDAKEFTGMRLYGLFANEHTVDHKPGFGKIWVPVSLLAHNKELLHLRNREEYACPRNYSHPCVRCIIGTDQCNAATHPRTFEQRTCRKCRAPRWCDPLFNGVCDECRRRSRTETTGKK